MGKATGKQIEALRKMGYAVKDDLSFEEASRLFDEHKAKKNPDWDIQKKEVPQAKPKAEYHLTPEQCRTNAVEAAQRWYGTLPNDPKEIEQFWNAVHAFERYING